MKKFIEYLNQHKKAIIVAGIIFVTSLAIISQVSKFYSNKKAKQKYIAYTEFQKDVKNNKVDAVWYTGSNQMQFVLYNKETKNMSRSDREQYSYPKKNRLVFRCF